MPASRSTSYCAGVSCSRHSSRTSRPSARSQSHADYVLAPTCGPRCAAPGIVILRSRHDRTSTGSRRSWACTARSALHRPSVLHDVTHVNFSASARGHAQLQVVGAVVHEPRHAARRDQLGHADHRAARPRALAAREPAGARVGDPRLSDRRDRARADGRTAVGPVRAQARLRRRLRRVRGGLARRRFLARRDRADPLAHPAGHRLGIPVRERRRARDRCVPQGGIGPGDGRQHDGRRDRARARPGARRRARGDQLALGVLVQRPARARGRRLGRADPARARQARTRAQL